MQTFIHVDVAVVEILSYFLKFSGNNFPFQCRELKRRNLIREQAKFEKEQAKFDREEKKYRRRSVLTTPRSTVSKVKSGIPDQQEGEEELALAGASVDDVEWEYVNKLCEDDILGGVAKLLRSWQFVIILIRYFCSDETILGKLSKFVVHVCKHQQKYNNSDLQASAALAMSKLMIVRYGKFKTFF